MLSEIKNSVKGVAAISFVSLDSRDEDLQAKHFIFFPFDSCTQHALATLREGGIAELMYFSITVTLKEQPHIIYLCAINKLVH